MRSVFVVILICATASAVVLRESDHYMDAVAIDSYLFEDSVYADIDIQGPDVAITMGRPFDIAQDYNDLASVALAAARALDTASWDLDSLIIYYDDRVIVVPDSVCSQALTQHRAGFTDVAIRNFVISRVAFTSY